MVCDDILIVSGMAFETKHARDLSDKTVYGLDAARLAADIESAMKAGVKAVVSFGTAGGISPILKSGNFVVASKILTRGEVFTTEQKFSENLCRALPEAIFAPMLGADNPVINAGEKARLWQQTSTVAVDMESHILARLAKKYDLPFAVLRVVLDEFDCTLPPAALAATNNNGTVNYFRLAGSIIAQPRQISALKQLGKAHATAKKSLRSCVTLLDAYGFNSVHLLG